MQTTVPPPTLGELQRQGTRRLRGAGLDEADLVAEVLVRHAAGLDRAGLLRDLREPAGPGVIEALARLLERAERGEPLAYIVGHREFYGLDLLTDRRALIPRPETESLVELGLTWGRALQAAGCREPLIVDVGTGTSAIALALAAHLPGARVIGIDLSAEALALARENARRLGLAGRVRFVQGDLLAPLRWRPHLTVANLPYVPEGRLAHLPVGIREWEPRLALAGGADGLDLYRRLLAQWHTLPPRSGRREDCAWSRQGRAAASSAAGAGVSDVLLFEIGSDQAGAGVTLAAALATGCQVGVRHDLGGAERVIEVTRADGVCDG